jgi:hypothetical protein
MSWPSASLRFVAEEDFSLEEEVDVEDFSLEEVVESEVTWTCDGPSWVLSRRRAVLAAVSFSKVTLADCEEAPSELTEREEIFPQKLKKSLISFSELEECQ